MVVRALNFTVTRLMKPQRLAIFLICGAITAACGLTVEVPQTVVVRLARNGYPIQGAKLRYYSQPECSGAYVEAVTDSAGVANFARVAHRGRYAANLEQPSLCLPAGETWSRVWTITYDPPEKLLLDCDRSMRPSNMCVRIASTASNDRSRGP